MIAFLLLAVAVILFFSSNEKLKRYVVYALGGLALTAVVLLGFTLETGTNSKVTIGSEKAVVQDVILEQSK
ncbi:hypothetical protein [Paenibacillus sp. TC-CSREp1]|uniref:hypothetical protein n=1 Tax=Paenibacillus sp. TC-CSREp1 TaxID=3410089 RepID=UPI003CFAE32A